MAGLLPGPMPNFPSWRKVSDWGESCQFGALQGVGEVAGENNGLSTLMLATDRGKGTHEGTDVVWGVFPNQFHWGRLSGSVSDVARTRFKWELSANAD